jgi:Family of unknown function (DUF6504)
MRRIRGEPVEVWLRHGKPARFVWRGRLHIVLFVLDHRVGQPVPGSGDRETADQPGPEFWLVEATAQQATTAATYELRHDQVSGRWSLSRN